ncbi:MAG TPA: sulfite exporter TauE/SafE family protein [Gemmatimonadaceae bacterium]|jgi:uncharacterized membrane protein YfcA
MQQSPAPSSTAVAAHTGLFIALALFTVVFLVVLFRAMSARAADGEDIKSSRGIWIVSFIANFFDTLGIGSYATTTSMFRQWRLVPDEKIPGTLNVGYVLPTVVQAYIYTTIVPIDPTTLILMIAASVAGAYLGAGVVSSWNRRTIQIGMGVCLLAAALLFTRAAITGFAGKPWALEHAPILTSLAATIGTPGGTLLKLTGAKLGIAIGVNFFLGALMTLGIGLYGPCMILISLLGMDPTAAYPIMMGSCAFLMPMASVRFVRTRGYDLKAILGMMIAGIPAVLVAAFIVKAMDIDYVRVLVIVVVAYTGIGMLRSARRERDIASQATAAEAQPA